MKKTLLFAAILLMGICSETYAQDNSNENSTDKKTDNKKSVCSKAYIGVSMGIDNPGGLIGLDIDVPVLTNLSLSAGYGPGSWGSKVYLGARYYLKPCHRGWAFGAGVSRSSGLKNYQMNMETIYGKEDVVLDFNPQTNLFLGVYHFWTLGKHANRVFVEAGYSLPFSTYSYTERYGDPLSRTSESVIKIISPGGLMVGFGFSFSVIK
ncbi:MAG: hypothetical protein JWQ38_1992 [Flavipsychrobacter sp.]|nr:hypothetical protein [Flavipsychrobacter sp.]